MARIGTKITCRERSPKNELREILFCIVECWQVCKLIKIMSLGGRQYRSYIVSHRKYLYHIISRKFQRCWLLFSSIVRVSRDEQWWTGRDSPSVPAVTWRAAVDAGDQHEQVAACGVETQGQQPREPTSFIYTWIRYLLLFPYFCFLCLHSIRGDILFLAQFLSIAMP